MMGEKMFQEIKRLEAVSTPNLLISTFHEKFSEEAQEHQYDSENEELKRALSSEH